MDTGTWTSRINTTVTTTDEAHPPNRPALELAPYSHFCIKLHPAALERAPTLERAPAPLLPSTIPPTVPPCLAGASPASFFFLFSTSIAPNALTSAALPLEPTPDVVD